MFVGFILDMQYVGRLIPCESQPRERERVRVRERRTEGGLFVCLIEERPSSGQYCRDAVSNIRRLVGGPKQDSSQTSIELLPSLNLTSSNLSCECASTYIPYICRWSDFVQQSPSLPTTTPYNV